MLRGMRTEGDGGHTMTGVELIAVERKRQIEEEGWTAEHDDREHGIGDLARAASCYAALVMYENPGEARNPPALWPWSTMDWHPSPNQLWNLAKAGALIAAEMDRLMRIET